MLPTLDYVVKQIGIPGLKKLAIALTDEDTNNWIVAKDFGLTIWQVRVCRQFLPAICNIVLKSNQKSCIILPFKQSQKTAA